MCELQLVCRLLVVAVGGETLFWRENNAAIIPIVFALWGCVLIRGCRGACR